MLCNIVHIGLQYNITIVLYLYYSIIVLLYYSFLHNLKCHLICDPERGRRWGGIFFWSLGGWPTSGPRRPRDTPQEKNVWELVSDVIFKLKFSAETLVT